jgi:lysophospholipase L1-like esterase
VFNDNSELLVERLDKDVISEHPNYVLIGVGGNDCNFNWEEVAKNPEKKHEPVVSMIDYIENIKRIVIEVKESNITPILLTLPPLDPVKYYQFIANRYGTVISHWISSCGGIEHWHSLYNLHLKTLITQLDVSSIDVRSALKKAGNITNFISDDGIHLNSLGYSEMGSIIYKELLLLTNSDKTQIQ